MKALNQTTATITKGMDDHEVSYSIGEKAILTDWSLIYNSPNYKGNREVEISGFKVRESRFLGNILYAKIIEKDGKKRTVELSRLEKIN
jgi:hypothetical protein